MAYWLRWGGMAVVLVLLLAILSVPLYAATPAVSTITVSSTLDVLDPEDGVCTLREAITAANDNAPSGEASGECDPGNGEDTILVPTGTYTLTIEGQFEDENLTGDLDILAAAVISSTGAVTVTANQIDRVFDIAVANYAEVTLKGLTITGGRAVPHEGEIGGGGIQSLATLVLEYCYITNNYAVYDPLVASGEGGGVFNWGILEIRNSEIVSNTAEAVGGAVAYENYTSDGGFSVRDSIFSHNQAAGGGAFFVKTGTGLNIYRALFQENRAMDAEDGNPDGARGGTGGAIVVIPDYDTPERINLTINFTDFVGNRAGNGGDGTNTGGKGGEAGALYAGVGSIHLTDVSFDGNHGGNGGNGEQNGGDGGSAGAMLFAAIAVDLERVTFTDNIAGDGGNGSDTGGNGGDGTLVTYAPLTTFRGGTVAGNRAGIGGTGATFGLDGRGGGAFFRDSAELSNVTFHHNQGRLGGGIYSEIETTLRQSTVSNNVAQQGGGIYSNSGVLTLINSTVAFNSAGGEGLPRQGGGVYLTPNNSSGIFHNTIVANNSANDTGNDVFGTVGTSSYLFLEDHTGATVEGEGNIYNQDPQLLPLADNGGSTLTHLPSDTSPVLDAGECTPFVDQRRLPRPVDLAQPDAANGCDIGSVEVQGPVATPTATPLPTTTATTIATGTPTVTHTPTISPTAVWHLYLPLVEREP